MTVQEIRIRPLGWPNFKLLPELTNAPDLRWLISSSTACSSSVTTSPPWGAKGGSIASSVSSRKFVAMGRGTKPASCARARNSLSLRWMLCTGTPCTNKKGDRGSPWSNSPRAGMRMCSPPAEVSTSVDSLVSQIDVQFSKVPGNLAHSVQHPFPRHDVKSADRVKLQNCRIWGLLHQGLQCFRPDGKRVCPSPLVVPALDHLVHTRWSSAGALFKY